MDDLNRRLADWLATPVGSLLGFVLALLVRLTISRLAERGGKHAKKRKPKHAT
jgi:hypothetical protein